MKNIALIFVSLFIFSFSFSQRKTKITINIPQQDTTRLQAKLFLQDPLQGINKGYYSDTLEIKAGTCQFSFDIENTSLVNLIINDKFVAYPGPYEILIEPADELIFDLPPLKEAGRYGFGFAKINVRGKGSEKVNMAKSMVSKYFEIFASDLPYNKQSLTYMFKTTDRKLNVIDSVYNENMGVPMQIKDLIKAQLYGDLFVTLFRSCKRTESDSLPLLFNEYIVKKKRIDVFYKKGIIKYFGSGSVPSFLILSEFKKPIIVGGEEYPKKHPQQYAELLYKRLKKNPEIRDYLLSDFLISTILRSLDSNVISLYDYYLNHADFNNPNFASVVKTYEEAQKKFAVGTPFFDFSLPDSTGKIHSLSDFKGKVVVFDFWYNGCAGCKLMVPVLEGIEKELKDKNIVFISVGIDKKQLWLDGIGKYSSSRSLQLYTAEKTDKHPMIKYLNIYGYPRLIIVDKNGNIGVAPPDPRMNKEAFVNLVESL